MTINLIYNEIEVGKVDVKVLPEVGDTLTFDSEGPFTIVNLKVIFVDSSKNPPIVRCR